MERSGGVVADEMRFGEPLPSGWEHSSSVY